MRFFFWLVYSFSRLVKCVTVIIMEQIDFQEIKKNSSLEKLERETKILNKEGKPLLMYNRSHEDFDTYELGKRNVNKEGGNHIGFFFSDRDNLEHYGEFKRSRYLNIKNPLDIRLLGYSTTYRDFRACLSDLGITEKDLAAYDRHFQDMTIARNKRIGSISGLHTPSQPKEGMSDVSMATFNFFDAGDGYYLRKLLIDKGIDGVIFSDESNMTVIAFEDDQIINPEDSNT